MRATSALASSCRAACTSPYPRRRTRSTRRQAQLTPPHVSVPASCPPLLEDEDDDEDDDDVFPPLDDDELVPPLRPEEIVVVDDAGRRRGVGSDPVHATTIAVSHMAPAPTPPATPAASFDP